MFDCELEALRQNQNERFKKIMNVTKKLEYFASQLNWYKVNTLN